MKKNRAILDKVPITIDEEAERYFVQYWFSVNRDVLLREFRDLYDALFERYLPIYKEGRERHIDLRSIDEKFKASFESDPMKVR